jgi:hypothetical protein
MTGSEGGLGNLRADAVGRARDEASFAHVAFRVPMPPGLALRRSLEANGPGTERNVSPKGLPNPLGIQEIYPRQSELCNLFL